MKIRTHKFYVSSIRKTPREQRWEVELFTQPWKNYWWARLYHWYDMRIPVRIPGWRLLERLLCRMGAQHLPSQMGETPNDWKDRLLSWPVNQDFICYRNDIRNRTHLGNVEIDPVTWQKLR